MKLKIQSAGRRGTLTNAMYMGYRTEVKHTNHITIWLWDLLVFAQCFSSNSRADTCLHRLHPTAAFCTANHWTDWTPWGLRWWPPTLFVREKQKRSFWCVAVKIYLPFSPLTAKTLGNTFGKKKQKFACSESRWLGAEVSPPTAVTRGSNMHTAASRSNFAQTATRQRWKIGRN